MARVGVVEGDPCDVPEPATAKAGYRSADAIRMELVIGLSLTTVPPRRR